MKAFHWRLISTQYLTITFFGGPFLPAFIGTCCCYCGCGVLVVYNVGCAFRGHLFLIIVVVMAVTVMGVHAGNPLSCSSLAMARLHDLQN